MSAAPTTDLTVQLRTALRAVEDAVESISDVAEPLDRIGVSVRLHHVIECLYTALDREVDDPAHADGVNVAARVLSEGRAMCAASATSTPSAALARVVSRLGEALTKLQEAAEISSRLLLAMRNFGRRTPLVARSFRASRGIPELFALPRGRLLPQLRNDVQSAPPASPPAVPTIPRPKTHAELQALHEAFKSGAFVESLEAAAANETKPAAEERTPIVELAYEPSVEEGETQRTLARDCLEDIANLSFLRKPIPSEGWHDQAPFERRMLANLDAFASFGGVGLQIVSLFHAEAEIPDAGRAFACALALGCFEGNDTVHHATARMAKAPREELGGFATALWLCSNPAVDGALAELLASSRAEVVAAAIEALGRRGALSAAEIPKLAARDEPIVRLALARALGRCGDGAIALEVLDGWAFERTAASDDDLFALSVESMLRRGADVRPLLRETMHRAPSVRRANVAAWLLSLSGAPSDFDLLAANVAARPSVLALRGLGRFGCVSAFESLLAALRLDDEALVDEAANALETIFGAGKHSTIEVPWDVALPEGIDLDDVGAGPIPGRKVEKVSTDREEWARWFEEHRARFDVGAKHRFGKPFHPTMLVDELKNARTPPARRFDVACELVVSTGDGVDLFVDDWVARQKEKLAELRDRVASRSSLVGGWWFGGASAGSRVKESRSGSNSRISAVVAPERARSTPSFAAVFARRDTPQPMPTISTSSQPPYATPLPSPSPIGPSTPLPAPTPIGPPTPLPAPTSVAPSPLRPSAVPEAPSDFPLLAYAMLSAELYAAPAAAERAYEKFGLTDARRRAAVLSAWAARIEASAEERAEFQRLRDRALQNWRGGLGDRRE